MRGPTIGTNYVNGPHAQRITAEEIRPDDRVARARTHSFNEVERVEQHAATVSVYYVGKGGGGYGAKDRPRKAAKWWRAV